MNTVTISLEKYEEMKNEISALKEFLNADKLIVTRYLDSNRTRYSTRMVDEVIENYEKTIKQYKEMYFEQFFKTEKLILKIEKSILCKLFKIKL